MEINKITDDEVEVLETINKREVYDREELEIEKNSLEKRLTFINSLLEKLK